MLISTGNKMVCLSMKPATGPIQPYVNGLLHCDLSQELYCRWSFLFYYCIFGKAAAVWTLSESVHPAKTLYFPGGGDDIYPFPLLDQCYLPGLHDELTCNLTVNLTSVKFEIQ